MVPKFIKLLFVSLNVIVWSPAQSQGPVLVSDLLLKEVRAIMVRDMLLLSDNIKKQENNNYWDSPKKKEKTIKDYEAFWDNVKNKFIPPQCSVQPLADSLVLDGESLLTLGGRLFPAGNMRTNFRGSFPDYKIPPGFGLGIPLGEVGNDNSYFNFTSRQLFTLDSKNKLTLGGGVSVGARVQVSVDAYIANGKEQAHQISYTCGTFKNYLGEVAKNIRDYGTFEPQDLPLLREFWEKSIRFNQHDSLLISFGGVCIYSSKSTDSFEKKTVDAALQGGFQAVIVNAKTDTRVSRQTERSTQSTEAGYKILLFTRPFFTTPPTVTDIKNAWKNVFISKVIDEPYSLLSTNEAVIKMVVGPIDSVMYKAIRIDEDYTLRHLKHPGLINKPRLELENVGSNAVGDYKLSVKISVNEAHNMNAEAASDLIKGGSFDLPLRLYYGKTAGRDTLTIFESTTAASVRYQNFPIVESAPKFELLTNIADTANYYFKGEIQVQLNDGDFLLPSKNMISKIRKSISDTLAIHPNLNTRLSWPTGLVNESGNAYTISELKLPKDYFSGRHDMFTMEVEIFVKHSKNPTGSRRITTITLPLSQ